MSDLSNVLMNKVILKLSNKVAKLTLEMAEIEAKSEMYKELLELKENELKRLQDKSQEATN